MSVLLASAGCRSKSAPVPPPTAPLEYDEDDEDESADEPGAAKAGAGKGPGGCMAGGTRWDGKQDGCLYEVGGCCYPDAASACAAAGCDAGGCQILEFSPAQITCRAK